MSKYLVTLPIEGTVTYLVEADNEQEAREIAYDCDGDGEIKGVLWDTADSENHTIEVWIVEGEED